MGRDRYKDLMEDHSYDDDRYNDGDKYEDDEEYDGDEYEDDEEYEDEEYEDEEEEDSSVNSKGKDAPAGNRLQIPISFASGKKNDGGGGGGNRLNIPMPNKKPEENKPTAPQGTNQPRYAQTASPSQPAASIKAAPVSQSQVEEKKSPSSADSSPKREQEDKPDFSPLQEGEDFDDTFKEKESLVSRLRRMVASPLRLLSFKKRNRGEEDVDEMEGNGEGTEEIAPVSAKIEIKNPEPMGKEKSSKSENIEEDSSETGEEDGEQRESFFRRKFMAPISSIPQKTKGILSSFHKKLEDTEEDAEKDIAEALSDTAVRDWKGILKKTGWITLAATLLLTGGYTALTYYNYQKTNKKDADSQIAKSEENTSDASASASGEVTPVPAAVDISASSEELGTDAADDLAADSSAMEEEFAEESSEELPEEFVEETTDETTDEMDPLPAETEVADVQDSQDNLEESASEEESFPDFNSLTETSLSEGEATDETAEKTVEEAVVEPIAPTVVEGIAAADSAEAENSFDFDSSPAEDSLAAIPTDNPPSTEAALPPASSLNVKIQETADGVQNQLNELGTQTQAAVQEFGSSLQNDVAELNAELQTAVEQGTEKLQQTGENIQNQTVSSLNTVQNQIQTTTNDVQDALTSSANSSTNSRSAPLSVTLSQPAAASSEGQTASSSLGSSLNSSLTRTSSLGSQSSLGTSPSAARQESLASTAPLNTAQTTISGFAETVSSLNNTAENSQTLNNSSSSVSSADSSLAASSPTAAAAVTPINGNGQENVNVVASSNAETETLSDLDGMSLPPLSVSTLSNSPVRDYSETGAINSTGNGTTGTSGNQNGELSNLDSFQGNSYSQGQGTSSNLAVQSNETGIFAQNTVMTNNADVVSQTAGGAYREYVTKTGDNLLTIAENELGDSTRWTEIRQLNPNKKLIGTLSAGQTILLPAE